MNNPLQINLENVNIEFIHMGKDKQRFERISQMIFRMVYEKIGTRVAELGIKPVTINIEDIHIPSVKISSEMNEYEIAEKTASVVFNNVAGSL